MYDLFYPSDSSPAAETWRSFHTMRKDGIARVVRALIQACLSQNRRKASIVDEELGALADKLIDASYIEESHILKNFTYM